MDNIKNIYKSLTEICLKTENLPLQIVGICFTKKQAIGVIKSIDLIKLKKVLGNREIKRFNKIKIKMESFVNNN
tara:strand:- start:8 stop:229 length:222 start_codon:yes stop_codon:yes gene_type:complete